MKNTSSVMFVCLGNICRSPAGEGVLKNLARRKGLEKTIHCQSSGTGSWHVGSRPDRRMLAAARRRGIELTSRAQVFRPDFFSIFDYILAADQSVRQDLLGLAPPGESQKVFLINDFSGAFTGQDVPDPYYGGEDGFEKVLDMLEDACEGLLRNIAPASTQDMV